MAKIKRTNELQKINILITILIVITNAILFFGINCGKSNYTIYNAYISGFLFFLYMYLFRNELQKDVLKIKREALYFNYPALLLNFTALLIIILIASSIYLIIINRDAANAVFIFILFMSTLSMLFPSILLAAFMYFFVPAVVIPKIPYIPSKGKIKQKKQNNSKPLLLIFFIIYTFICVVSLITRLGITSNYDSQEKYKSSLVSMNYSTEFLKLDKISDYGKKLMSRDKLNIPFLYTSKSFPFKDYDVAERFCNSMNARIPNYMEIYHIVFNEFNTFGEQYYWTSDKDRGQHLVLHFKNMSYKVTKNNKEETPLLFCVTEKSDKYGLENNFYFYRTAKFEEKEDEDIKALIENSLDFNSLQELINADAEYNKNDNELDEILKSEKKHVSFSVKEVSPDIFQNLIYSGYYYDPTIKLKKDYEINEYALSSIVRKDTNEIRLCHYPFTEYSNLNLKQQKEIWEQSFCSPAFDLISKTPLLAAKNNKDSICRTTQGGRLPNIPELNGILKTLGRNETNVKYWINSNVTNQQTNETMPVIVYFRDSRFMEVKAITPSDTSQGYAYCIQDAQRPSGVIANYKSMFINTDGRTYAKQRCPECSYYEVPDTILSE